jgi:hypothetical protein
MKTNDNTRIDDERTSGTTTSTWVCSKCNVVVDSPIANRTGKKTCALGHELSEVTAFWPIVIGLTISWPLYRTAFLLLGLVWAPLEQIWGYGLLAMLFLIVWMPIQGIAYLIRGGPVRTLAPACFAMAIGSLAGGAVTGIALMSIFGKAAIK